MSALPAASVHVSARVSDSGGISTDPKMVVNTGWYQGKTCFSEG